MGNIKIVNGAPTRIPDSDRHRLLLDQEPSRRWLGALQEAANATAEGQSLRFEYQGARSLLFTSPMDNFRENMKLVNALIRQANEKANG